MRQLLLGAACALAMSCAAEPEAAPRSRQPVPTPSPAKLPSGVTACGVLGEVKDGATCEILDTATGTFVDADPLTRRAFLYERWLDLHHAPEGQVVNRQHSKRVEPGTPEADWSAADTLLEWDGYGDSSLWTHTALIAAALRFASTGTDADQARLEHYARAALRFFEATGADGYQARFVYAAVPPGTRARDGIAMAPLGEPDPIVVDVPADRVAALPASMREPLPDGAGGTIAVKPVWRGYPSIDQYSGPLASLPIAVPLLRDRTLAAALVKHLDCFAKRLRIFRISHLSESPEIASALASYLGALDSNLEPGEPDPAKAEEIWGFYLPQKNTTNAATYPSKCPATLAFEPDAELDLDARDPLFQNQFIDLVLRQSSAGAANAMDFAFFPSVRAGDALQMLALAHAGHQLTGDAAYLRWHDDLLVKQLAAPAMVATLDAYLLPKACSSYYREHNLVMTEYARLLATPDGAERDLHLKLFGSDFGRRMIPTASPLYELALAAVDVKANPRVPALLTEFEGFGGTASHLDDPRRNWDTDNVVDPPAGITIAAPTAADKAICEKGITLFGIPIAGDKVSDSVRYADKALPLMRRVNEDFSWQRDPFNAFRHHGGAEGTQQYPGLDLTLPYWMARAHGQLGPRTTVLAWKPSK